MNSEQKIQKYKIFSTKEDTLFVSGLLRLHRLTVSWKNMIFSVEPLIKFSFVIFNMILIILCVVSGGATNHCPLQYYYHKILMYGGSWGVALLNFKNIKSLKHQKATQLIVAGSSRLMKVMEVVVGFLLLKFLSESFPVGSDLGRLFSLKGFFSLFSPINSIENSVSLSNLDGVRLLKSNS